MHALAARFELRLPACHSLKEKRAVLRPVIDRARHRHVSISEVERLVWSRPDIEVLDVDRRWLDLGD